MSDLTARARALLGHINTLRLSGRDDGMVDDMQRATDEIERLTADLVAANAAAANLKTVMTAAAIALQLWIAVTGLAAIALLQFGGARARRWAPFIGLAGQPAWLWYAVDAHDALGIGIVSAAYTVVWLAGCVKEMRR